MNETRDEWKRRIAIYERYIDGWWVGYGDERDWEKYLHGLSFAERAAWKMGYDDGSKMSQDVRFASAPERNEK